jgi:hypothetical protein
LCNKATFPEEKLTRQKLIAERRQINKIIKYGHVKNQTETHRKF